MKNILITGGAGFIANELIRNLTTDPENYIIVIDNLILGTENNISKFKTNFEFIKGDVTDNDLLETLFDKYNFDLIYHFAANSDISISFENPNIDYINTFNTTWQLLNTMKKFNCKNLIFASTSAIFGELKGNISENDGPLNPISHYGAAKLASEAFISSFVHNYDFNVLIVRFPNVVGGNSTHGVIYDFINKLKSNNKELIVLGNGKQEKSYLHVSDLINAIFYCWSNKKELLTVFNISGNDTISVKKIAEIVVEHISPGAKIIYTGTERGWKGDVTNFSYDNSKLLNSGWNFKYNSTDSVKLAVEENIKHDN